MARKSISEDQWKFARSQWEAEPLLTHAQVGASLGISKQAVQKRAKEQQWQKRISIQQATDRAYEVADAASAVSDEENPKNAARPSKRAPHVVADVPVNQPGRTEPLSDYERNALALEAAVTQRAEVLARHRKEIGAPRNTIYAALKENDFGKAKLGKAAAEALKTLQEAERKAWGFDREDGKTQTIVIDRGGRRE